MEKVPATERDVVRDLAKQVRDLAHSPAMQSLRERWRRHNAGEPTEPLVFLENGILADQFLPSPRCRHPLALDMERRLSEILYMDREVGDDRIVPTVYPVPYWPDAGLFAVQAGRRTAEDRLGLHFGYQVEHPVHDLAADWPRLRPAVRRPVARDLEGARRQAAEADDLLGGILPAAPEHHSFTWHFGLTGHLVWLMGMEAMFVALMETPDLLRRALSDLVDLLLSALEEHEEGGALTLNNGHHYAGSGSLGCTDQLPAAGHAPGQVRSRDLWGNSNSQETVGVDPSAFRDHFLPHYRRLAERFGLLYWGCCEPVHTIWDYGLKDLPGLRKVSISPWCDERFMGSALRGSGIVYARKPSPNFVGVGAYDGEGLERHLQATMEAARGCALEISFRDILSLHGEPSRARRAVEAVRRAAARHWQP